MCAACKKKDEKADKFNSKVKPKQFQLTESSPVRVVQGSMSQQPEEFESNRGKQCTRNSFNIILHHATSIGESIKKLVIDAVFKVGDRLHTVL